MGTDQFRPALPERVPDAWGRVVRSITGLHRGAKVPTDFDREWGRFPGSAGRAPVSPICATNHAAAALAPTPGPDHDVANQRHNVWGVQSVLRCVLAHAGDHCAKWLGTGTRTSRVRPVTMIFSGAEPPIFLVAFSHFTPVNPGEELANH